MSKEMPSAEYVAERCDPQNGVFYWDDDVMAALVARHGDWMVSVMPMIYNDRVLLTHVDEYSTGWTAGWCYDKGGAAFLAAMAWNPLEDREPVGYKKVAGDSRPRVYTDEDS